MFDNVPKVLVFSHNCFSKTGSNGRTLGNFFINWPSNDLAQFYISSEIPDWSVCNNYFRVTDIEALKAFVNNENVGTIYTNDERGSHSNDRTRLLNTIYQRNRKRTPFNYLIRNLVWDSNRWRTKEFDDWVHGFDPDVVLIQLGDYAFMLRIALDVAMKKNIPLVIYNSEDYYFKDRRSLSPVYIYYRNDYKRQVKKLIEYSSHSIYISEMLQRTYTEEFDHKSSVIMTSSEVKPPKQKDTNISPQISYVGNLGVGRHEPLIEIARALENTDSNACLNIYGKAPSQEIEQALTTCKNICLRGFVSYEEVVTILRQSDLLIHCENSSKFYQWDLRHAFSTKIADYLSSGTCILAYGPENIASIGYLKDNGAACVVTDPDSLTNTINNLLSNKDYRQQFINRALNIAKLRHDRMENEKRFIDVINSVC